MLRAFSVFFLIITLIASACARSPAILSSSWAYADLRAYDAPDAFYADADIVAVYTRLIDAPMDHRPYDSFRSNGNVGELQIRLDFLDLTFQSRCDVYLLLDYWPGGSVILPWGDRTENEWDTLVKIPAGGVIEARDDQGNPMRDLAIRIERDSTLDMLTVSISSQAMPDIRRGVRIQVVTTLPGETSIADQVAPFRSDAFPPERAPVLFAFWNSLPAYTPAQALRRWDGAHTGPLGGRHGLYNLLRTSRGYSVPIVLLDLKSPASLAALDLLDGLPLVRKMASDGLLILPETIPDLTSLDNLPESFQSMAARFSRAVSLSFDLPASRFVYSPLRPDLPEGYPYVMARTRDASLAGASFPGLVVPIRWREKWIIPIPEQLPSAQATFEGFSLETRTALVRAALAANHPAARGKLTMLVLGGDLPASEWGDPQIARSAFRYLDAHPWMQVLDAHDLASLHPYRSSEKLPVQAGSPSPPVQDEVARQLVDELMALPQSSLQQEAWRAFFSLYGPAFPSPEALAALRRSYLGQVHVLIAAAEWAANPLPLASCEMDIDLDQRTECVLASSRIFIVSPSDTGALAYVFALDDTGVHQIMAPSSQFIVGTSSPDGWDLSRGLRSDPEVIPGAFSDDNGPYTYNITAERLSFEGKGLVKSYQLTSQGIRIEYRSNQAITTQIPLAVDPWSRTTPGWGERYRSKPTSRGWTWGLIGGLQVVIETNATAHPTTFTDTRKYLSMTEDPNREYPPGHYLPIPLALLSIHSQGDFYVELGWEADD